MTKCNNCRFKAKIDGIVTTGIVSAKDGLNAFLKNEQGYNVGCLTGAGLVDSDNRLITDFEIVPRDPETYQDWQVGDKVKRIVDELDLNKEVIFRSGELVICKTEQGVASDNYLCYELFRNGYRLVLTDIEKQIVEGGKEVRAAGRVVYAKVRHNDNDAIFIYKRGVENRIYGYAGYNIKFDRMVDTYGFAYITPNILGDLIEYRPATDEEKQQLFDAMAKAGKRWNAEKKVVEDISEQQKLRAFKSEIKSEIPHEFRKGEPVLVRGYEFHRWIIAAYVDKDKLGFIANAGVSVTHWKYCLPYNERTMHLLGTTEDYREEQL